MSARFSVFRTAILLAAGLAGIAYEALARDETRPYLLAIYALMLGLPAFLGLDGIAARVLDGRNGNGKRSSSPAAADNDAKT